MDDSDFDSFDFKQRIKELEKEKEELQVKLKQKTQELNEFK